MPQTDYDIYNQVGFEGQLATAFPNGVRHYTNTLGAVFPFGRVAVRPTVAGSDRDAVLPSGTGMLALGFTLSTQLQEKELTATGYPGWPAQREMDILAQGEIWAWAEEAVSPGQTVYYRHTASGGNTELGRVRNDADTGTADELPTARFVSSTTGAGLVKVAINLA